MSIIFGGYIMPDIKYKPMYRGYHRMLSGPLDDCSVFYSVEDLYRYVKYGTAYDGQNVILIDKNHAKNNSFEFTIIKENDALKLYPLFDFTYDKMYDNSTGILIYRHDFDFKNSDYEYSDDNLCILNNQYIYSICNLFKLFINNNGEYTCQINKYLPISLDTMTFPEPITNIWTQNFTPFEDGTTNGLYAYDNKWYQNEFEIDLFSPYSLSESECYIELYLGTNNSIIHIDPLFD